LFEFPSPTSDRWCASAPARRAKRRS